MLTWISAHPGVATALALLFALPLLYRGVARLAWPMQKRLADDIAWLRAREDLSDETRELVAFMGKHAFNGFAMMAFCLVLPFAIVVDAITSNANETDPLSGYSSDVQRVLDRAVHRFVLSIAAVNPVFAVLFAIELVVAIAITGLLHLVHLSTVKPLERAETSLRETLTLYDRNLGRFT